MELGMSKAVESRATPEARESAQFLVLVIAVALANLFRLENVSWNCHLGSGPLFRHSGSGTDFLFFLREN
jgi:hypothetical protein